MVNKKSPDNKGRFSINSLIYNDKYLIVLSLILAVLVWIGASLSMGNDENKTITVNVPVSLSEQVSEQLGVRYYLQQDNVELSITVTGAKYILGQISQDDLNITFDTSGVSRTGAQNIPILVSNKSKYLDYSVSSVYPSSIECYVDVNASKTIDMDVVYDSDRVADGYMFGYPVLSEDRIYVSGPKTFVDKIESAYVQLDFGEEDNLTEPFNQKCSILFKGTGIEQSYVEIHSNVNETDPLSEISVTLPVLKLQTLPINANFVGQPRNLPDGIMNVSYSMNEIRCGALDSANISTAEIGSIDFADLKVGLNTFDFDSASINGVVPLDSAGVVNVNVNISKKYKEYRVPISTGIVNIEGVDDGLEAYVSDISNNYVTIIAPKNSHFTTDDLIITCDMTDVTESGTQDMKISLKKDRSSWIYGHYYCDVTIK